MAAAPGGVARGDQGQRMVAAAFLDQFDEELGQRHRLGAHRGHVGLQRHVQPALHQRHRQDGLRAAQEAADAMCRLVCGGHVERAVVAPPSRQRLPEAVLVTLGHPDEGRRARAAVQVLVGAADGEVSLRGAQVHRHRTGRVGEVPDRQHAVAMRLAGDGGHVVHGAGAVVDVGQQQHGHVVAQRPLQRQLVVDQAQFVALLQQVDHAFDHVQVGGEVVALGHDHAALGKVRLLDAQRGGERLEDVERGGVGDHDLIVAGADQPSQLVAEAARQVEPVGGVPAPDQPHGPFLVQHLAGTGDGRLRLHAERVAVEVDHPFRQEEFLLQRGEVVEPICFQAGFTRLHFCRSPLAVRLRIAQGPGAPHAVVEAPPSP